jgi:hypothetical protein
MPDLSFAIDRAEPLRHAAEPLLLFRLRAAEALPPGEVPASILAVVLRCQIRIEPARRRYSEAEKGRLLDLFGSPERWGQTLRAIPWAHVGLVMPGFEGEAEADLPVPCTFDFSLAATRYFAAIEGGELPLRFLFSGSVFYRSPEGALQFAPIPRDREVGFRLPSRTWRDLRDLYYPDCSWLRLRRDVFEGLDRYRIRLGLPSGEDALERLLSAAGEPISP